MFRLFLLIVFCTSSDVLGQAKVFEFNKTAGSHNIKLRIETSEFVPKRHRIKQVSDERRQVYGTWIDGKYAFGTDVSVPKTQVSAFRLYFNGREVLVPKAMYSDCYNPNFANDYFRLRFADDGQSLMVFMAGSDGAGSYQVFWIFRKDGRHSRFSSPVSDAQWPVDFLQTFFEK